MNERRAGELVELAETAEPHLYGPGQREWRARLNAHAEEIEEALRFLLDAGATDAALRMAGALRLYWMDTGRVDQGREWLGSAVDADEGSPSLARALVAAGELAFRHGDQEVARSRTVEALRPPELFGDRSTAALAHANLARIALREGDAPAIERHAQDGIDASGNDLYARSRAVHMLAGAHTRRARRSGLGRCSWRASGSGGSLAITSERRSS